VPYRAILRGTTARGRQNVGPSGGVAHILLAIDGKQILEPMDNEAIEDRRWIH
jgi:hypothetical protein